MTPVAKRSAIELAFFGGLTHDQIAERTGVPLGTVKGRVRLGLRRLRHALQDLAPSSSETPSDSDASGLNDPALAETPYDRATLIAHDR